MTPEIGCLVIGSVVLFAGFVMTVTKTPPRAIWIAARGLFRD